jgi:hypothetical protein
MKRLQQIAFASILAIAVTSPALAGNIDFGKSTTTTGNIDFGKTSTGNIDFGSVVNAALMLIAIL